MVKEKTPNNVVYGKGNDYYLIESLQEICLFFSKGGVEYEKKSQL